MGTKAVICILAAILSITTMAVGSPKISVDEAEWDFGEVLEGFVANHNFLVTNRGDEELVISSIWTSCGCTTTALADNSLSPGESVSLEGILDTSGLSGYIADKTIYVESNDPLNPTLTLQMMGYVERGAQPERYHIPVDDLSYWFYILIDLRSKEAFEDGHLLGAVNVPPSALEGWIESFPRDALVVLYDQDGSRGDEVAQDLVAGGYPNARSLFGGLDEWKRRLGDTFVVKDIAEGSP